VTGPEELAEAVRKALAEAGLPEAEPAFERPRQREHGDWSTNVALALARRAGAPPRQVAQRLVDALPPLPDVQRVEIAGPGFINFRLSHGVLEETVRAAVTQGDDWGRRRADRSPGRVNVEFVSANPTGPLHVGHGRQAAVGDALASLLEWTGWDVSREYYFNDAGNQMVLFGQSVAAAARGEEPPGNGYHGAYIRELAGELKAAGELDDVVEAAYARMLAHIKATLGNLGVRFDTFFGERGLHDSGLVRDVLERLRARGHVYERDGAVWLRTTAFGDDKDRVVIKSDGAPTYFAADCAYLESKVDRGFDRLLYVLGADHHGYIRRLKAMAEALGQGADRVEVVLHQFVNLFRAGEAVRMSKRTGDIITFDELLAEVGADAARYTFLRYSLDVTIDFDLAEVVKAERENPVYYVQYSHARIAGILRTARERGVEVGHVSQARLDLLTHEREAELVRRIGTWPETVSYAADERAPHKVARYAEELAEAFHRFYTECQVLSDDEDLTRARYWLCVAARQTLVNALGILGVSAPDRM
jgi:arginyl-tRNA synthetase